MLRLETSEDRGTARRLSSLAENVICIGITRMLQTGIALGISLFERRQPRHSNRASLAPDLLRGNPNDRKRVVSGKSVSVRVDLGGGRIIKKKKKPLQTK